MKTTLTLLTLLIIGLGGCTRKQREHKNWILVRIDTTDNQWKSYPNCDDYYFRHEAELRCESISKSYRNVIYHVGDTVSFLHDHGTN